MNNISPVLPGFRPITSFNSARVPACWDAFVNSTKSSRPTASFIAATTASNGLDDVTLTRSISNLLMDNFMLPPGTHRDSRFDPSKSALGNEGGRGRDHEHF